MSLRISGKHMNVGEALNQRIEDRIDDAVTKYFDGGYDGHVTLEKSGSRFSCDCVIHLDSGALFQATADEMDPTASFEAAADKVEKRIRRYKRRLKDHHANAVSKGFDEGTYTVMASPGQEEEVPDDYAPAVIAESSTSIRTQSVADAVMQLDMTDQPVIVFTNAASNRTNVVYRRTDGNIGWVDPSRES